MKKLSLILLITGSTVAGAMAQEQVSDWPYWTISKRAQTNKFKNATFIQGAIKTGNSDWVTTKAVHKNARRTSATTGTVSMTGYPTWTISKGPARIQAERSSRK